MRTMKIYAKADAYKLGCVAGFYDALPDEGQRYLDDILRYGVEGHEDRAQFLAGYRAGCAARRDESSSAILRTDALCDASGI
jgi:hypothetical protein